MADGVAPASMTDIPLLINGEDVHTDVRFEVTNPATGRPIHTSSSASLEDVELAVASAYNAFREYNQLVPHERQKLLFKAAELMEGRKDEILSCQASETGVSPGFASFTFDLGTAFLRHTAGTMLSLEGALPPVATPGMDAMVIKEPYGVILSIAPWNAPIILGMRAIALPLAAGNTVVLKGSEFCPETFWKLTDLFRQAGFPKGCVNFVAHRPADASSITTALIAHPRVRKINFTGSTRVGSIVASLAGKYIKPVLLELGGKASCIVLDDADLQKAAAEAAVGAFLNGGQICMSTERVIVQKSVADAFRQEFVKVTEKQFGSGIQVPMLVASSAAQRLGRLVRDAVSKGARPVFGREPDSGNTGASFKPLVLEDVTKEMDIFSLESFGPTVSLYVVDTDEEAIALANDTEYGLTSSVFTDNLRRGLRVARKIEAGAVHINSMTVHDEPTLPHGGYKSSGHGRFGGSRGLDEFVQTKIVTWA